MGHLSELDYYLKKILFDSYVSKTTGEVNGAEGVGALPAVGDAWLDSWVLIDSWVSLLLLLCVQTYPGGKVERELEEVCETLDDFVALAAGQTVPPRVD